MPTEAERQFNDAMLNIYRPERWPPRRESPAVRDIEACSRGGPDQRGSARGAGGPQRA